MKPITKEQFDTYQRIQKRGITNMVDVSMLTELSDGLLDADSIYEITSNYSEYKYKFENTIQQHEMLDAMKQQSAKRPLTGNTTTKEAEELLFNATKENK